MSMMKPLAAMLLIAAPVSIAHARSDTSAATYVAKAGSSDLFERQSAALMMRSENPKVRDFAAMMARDHTTSTSNVKSAAKVARLRVSPPMLNRMQSRDLVALRAARGADRDRLYIDQQKLAHRDALMLQQGYATDGGVRSLRMAATKIVPVVKHHIDMLEAM